MTIVTETEFTQEPGNILRKVKKGETIHIISKNKKRVGKVMPAKKQRRILSEKRPFGLAKGEFKLGKEFFETLPDNILDAFEGV